MAYSPVVVSPAPSVAASVAGDAPPSHAAVHVQQAQQHPVRSTWTIAAQFPVHMVPVVANVLALTTIIICKTMSDYLGHTPLISDITHSGRGYPERFIFRAGLIPACVLVAFVWCLVRVFLSALIRLYPGTPPAELEKYNVRMFWAGVIGAGCLIIASSVLEDDGTTEWTVHTINATLFFILTWTSQAHCTYILYLLRKDAPLTREVVTTTSFKAKVLLSGTTLAFLLLDLGLQIVNKTDYSDVCEWILVFSLLAYNITYYWDFHSQYNLDAAVDF